MIQQLDVLVIGGGTAGNAASRALAAAGLDVAVAEPGRVGGTCLWAGCMPKKALFNSAMAYREMLDADQFGIVAGDITIDWPGVLAWKWHAQETYAGDQEGIMASRGIRHLGAAARFLSAERVAVGTDIFEPDSVVVACGSSPVVPPIPGAELADTSDDALRYPDLPTSLVIVGAGYIAMEFAGIFAAFGTKVTVLVRSEVLAPFDPETVAVAVTRLEQLGVRFLRGAEVAGISGMAGDLTVTYHSGGRTHDLEAERVLLATGRRPALDALDLPLAGVELDARGAPVLDDALHSTNPRVWFAGDATGHMMLTPIANVHGGAVARSILTGEPHPVDTSAIPTACFTMPELAQVGLSERDAIQRDISHRIVRGTSDPVGAAIIADHREGLIKLVVADDGTLLGAHIAGYRASDLIYTYALAVRAGITLDQIAATRAVHPAFTEVINWTVPPA